MIENVFGSCSSFAELSTLLESANNLVDIDSKLGCSTFGIPRRSQGVLNDLMLTLSYLAQGTLEDDRLETISMDNVVNAPSSAYAQTTTRRFETGPFWTDRAMLASRQELTDNLRPLYSPFTDEAVPECVNMTLNELNSMLSVEGSSLPLNVDDLDDQKLVAGNKDDWVEVSADWPALWDQLQLEPYAQLKNVQCYVVCPDSQAEDVRPFFLDLCVAYSQLCHLGRHTLATDFPGASDGVVRVPSGLTVDGSRDAKGENYLRQYVAKAAALGAHITDYLKRELRTDPCVVVYFVDPFTREHDVDSYSDVVCSMVELLRYTAQTPCPGALPQVVVEPVPISRIIPYRPDTRTMLRDLALNVYTKIRRGTFGQQPFPLISQPMPEPDYLAYEPPYVLSCIPPEHSQTQTQAFVVHICYEFSQDRNWIVSTLTDSVGELMQTFAVPNLRTESSGGKLVVSSPSSASGSSSGAFTIVQENSSDGPGSDGSGSGRGGGSGSGNGGGSGDSPLDLHIAMAQGDYGMESASSSPSSPFEECFLQWMAFLRKVDPSKGWTLAITSLGVMTEAEFHSWNYVINRHFSDSPKPKLVTLLSLRLAPHWQLLDTSTTPNQRPSDTTCDSLSRRTVMIIPESIPVYEVDLNSAVPEAVAIVSTPAPVPKREARWPVAYMVSLMRQYSESTTKTLPPQLTVQVLARQINALSWLNVLPSAPSRCSVLPRHALITHRLASLYVLLPTVLRFVSASDGPESSSTPPSARF